MGYLKLRSPNQLYGQLHGATDGVHRLELMEDIKGDFFIHEEIKLHPVWSKFNNLFNQLEVVETIEPKPPQE
jgi:hypothetical protein